MCVCVCYKFPITNWWVLGKTVSSITFGVIFNILNVGSKVFRILSIYYRCDETLPCCARPGGELTPTEDHLEGLRRLLNEVCCAVCSLNHTFCSSYFSNTLSQYWSVDWLGKATPKERIVIYWLLYNEVVWHEIVHSWVIIRLTVIQAVWLQLLFMFTRDSIYAIARICHGNSVRLSVCHTGGSVKNGWS